MPAYEIAHVDTCLPDYLTDHHNRPGHWLVGVPCASDHDDPIALFLDLLASEHDDAPNTEDPAFEALARESLAAVPFALPFPDCDPEEPPYVWILVRALS